TTAEAWNSKTLADHPLAWPKAVSNAETHNSRQRSHFSRVRYRAGDAEPVVAVEKTSLSERNAKHLKIVRGYRIQIDWPARFILFSGRSPRNLRLNLCVAERDAGGNGCSGYAGSFA